MKKISIVLLILLVASSVVLLGFGYKHNVEPNHYYQVYLDEELLGTIKSKKQLEKYIDERGEYIKNKYDVDKIYKPNGLEIKKVTTYENKLISVKDIYEKILERKAFTIKGYQFTITDEEETLKIYVLDKNVFEEAVTQTIKTFVNGDRYESYLNDTQEEIKTTGTFANNIYVEEDITIKEVDIPVNETIYMNSKDLAKFLLFGTLEDQKSYTVEPGDTISRVADNNKISIAEFLISNPEFTSESNLLFPGQKVIIGVTNPQISVAVEETIVEEIVDKFQIIENVNPEKLIGDDTVVQEGEDGLSKVTRNTKTVNGIVLYSETEHREILKPSVDKVIEVGGKVIPNVGSLTSWGWPTNSGWVLTDTFTWRINPITGQRERHSGVDIAGTGYYSPIYAANNGTLETKRYQFDYGNYVVINHNNGYYTLYSHFAAFADQEVGDTIQRGEIIGYMGETGWATGVHLHLELWEGCRFCRINPLSVYDI